MHHAVGDQEKAEVDVAVEEFQEHWAEKRYTTQLPTFQVAKVRAKRENGQGWVNEEL